MFKTKQFWYITLFAILYLIVAFSSFWHAIAFFGLANNSWMSIILAFAFEVGQAAVLFSLLTSAKDRSRIMPWVLMIMFTLVQVIGNVYSSYKYIITNSVENLRYFKEPIFIWTDLPDNQANVIIVYLVGAILPVASLLLTSMITNYLTDEEEAKQLQEANVISEEKIETLDSDKGPSAPIIVNTKEEIDNIYGQQNTEEVENNDEIIKDINETELKDIDNKIDKENNQENNITEEDLNKIKDLMTNGINIDEKPIKKSHFIN